MRLHTGEIRIFFTQLSEHTEVRGYFPLARFLIVMPGKRQVFFPPPCLLTSQCPFWERSCHNQQWTQASTKSSCRKLIKRKLETCLWLILVPKAILEVEEPCSKVCLKNPHYNLAQPIILALYSLLDYNTNILKFLILSLSHTYGLPYINSLRCYLYRKKQSSGHTILHTLPVTRAETR